MIIDYMNENNVSAYDEKSHKGIVRRVFTRKIVFLKMRLWLSFG